MEWISVKDNLPEENVYVMTCDEDNYVQPGLILFGTWREYDYDDYYGHEELITEVTHWMPFPDPPKKDQS